MASLLIPFKNFLPSLPVPSPICLGKLLHPSSCFLACMPGGRCLNSIPKYDNAHLGCLVHLGHAQSIFCTVISPSYKKMDQTFYPLSQGMTVTRSKVLSTICRTLKGFVCTFTQTNCQVMNIIQARINRQIRIWTDKLPLLLLWQIPAIFRKFCQVFRKEK